MRAGAVVFRLRMPILGTLVIIGFWAPWIEARAPGPSFGTRTPLLEWLALELSRAVLVRFTAATPAVIVLAALLAAMGAALRVWGTAYLGPGAVHCAAMKAGGVLADGPYRYVRNPLYLGVGFMIAALAFIMPVSGALFAMGTVSAFLFILIRSEENFLSATLGEPYRAYLCAVPRLIPRLRSRLPHAGGKPHWGRAILAELNPIGIFLTFAVFSWSYDNWLMIRAILVSLGVSLVVRALMLGITRADGLPK